MSGITEQSVLNIYQETLDLTPRHAGAFLIPLWQKFPEVTKKSWQKIVLTCDSILCSSEILIDLWFSFHVVDFIIW